MTVEQVLTDAAAILSDESRWYQGNFHNDTRSQFCTMGAVFEASIENVEDYHAARKTLSMAIREQYPEFMLKNLRGFQGIGEPDDVHVPNWNDAESRTFEEVRAMFEKSIAYAAEHGL